MDVLVGLLVPAIDRDPHRAVFGVVDDDGARGLPDQPFGARDQRFQGRHGERGAGQRGLVFARQFGQVQAGGLGAGAIGRRDRRWHQREGRDHDAGIGDHELEGQGQHRGGVVRVQPRTLALAGAEGEEVLEDALVRHHAGNHRHQHRHGGEGHDPQAQGLRVQVVVEVDEVVAAEGGAACLVVVLVQFAAGLGVEFGVGVCAVRVEPVGHQAVVVVAVDRPDLPHAGAGVMPRHVLHRQIEPARAIHLHGLARRRLGLGRMVLRRHPVGDGFGEHRQRPGQEDGEQQPGKPQADPGVEPGHGQTETGFQNAPLSSIDAAASPAAGLLLRMVPILVEMGSE